MQKPAEVLVPVHQQQPPQQAGQGTLILAPLHQQQPRSKPDGRAASHRAGADRLRPCRAANAVLEELEESEGRAAVAEAAQAEVALDLQVCSRCTISEM